MDRKIEYRIHDMTATLEYLAGLGHRNANGGLEWGDGRERMSEHKAFWRHVREIAGAAAERGRKLLAEEAQ